MRMLGLFIKNGVVFEIFRGVVLEGDFVIEGDGVGSREC